MGAFDLCSTPAGYSERDFTGYSGGTDVADPYGWHNLETDSCRINFGWVRSNVGAPTYARIDFNRSATSTPRMDVTMQWSIMTAGTFSWGTANVGIGTAGSGDAFLTGPRVVLQVTGERDETPSGERSYRGLFTNTDGVDFTTDWVPFSFISGAVGSTHTYDFRVWVDGSTGYLQATNAGTGVVTTADVALSGSFSGAYGRWESHHAGGGGAGGGDNAGDLDATGQQKAAHGAITAINVGLRRRRPVVGRIGFG